MTTFVSPSSGGGGDRLNVSDVNGHHLIINVLSVENIQTTLGMSEAIKINVADLTTGLASTGVLWFSKVIVSNLKAQAGTGALVLCTVGQGVAKPGQNAPWILDDAAGIPEVVAAATAWLDANPGVIAGAIATPAPVQNLAPIANLAQTNSLGSLI